MKTPSKFLMAAGLIAALGTVAVAGASLADGRGDREHRGDRYGGGFGGGRQMMQSFDTNGDGNLTQAEIDAARAARFGQFDADGDGRLTLGEYEALWLDAMRERMVDGFQRLDDDGDAVVTAEEFTDPFAALVERMDRNDDGMLNSDDMPRRGRRGDSDD